MLNVHDLHNYQYKMIREIISKQSVALFVDMGLGKTISTLTAIEYLTRKKLVNRVLIIAPLRVALHTWQAEISNWGHTKHLEVNQLAGVNAKERTNRLIKECTINIINRENIPWLVETIGKGWKYDMVVIDESSSFKNASTKRFKALKKVLYKIKKCVLLTGTPASNGLIDIWSQIYLVDKGERLGKTFTSFKQKYYYENPYTYQLILRDFAEKEIQEKIKDVCVTLSASDYLELPPVIYNNIVVDIDTKERKAYKELEKEFITDFKENEIVASNSATLVNKLLQFANGAVYTEDSEFIEVHQAKIEALQSVIDENSGKSILVAYNYKSDLIRLKKAFKNATDLKEEKNVVEKWNSGKIQLLLAHPASAGHGLNLQKGGNIIVWFGLNWSLELYQQFNARLNRQGQTEKVFIHHIVLKDSVDNNVLEALANKDTTQAKLLNNLKTTIEARL